MHVMLMIANREWDETHTTVEFEKKRRHQVICYVESASVRQQSVGKEKNKGIQRKSERYCEKNYVVEIYAWSTSRELKIQNTVKTQNRRRPCMLEGQKVLALRGPNPHRVLPH